MENLNKILIMLKDLSVNDLFQLQHEISRHIYAQGIEEYLQALNIGRIIEKNNLLTNNADNLADKILE